MNVCEEWEGANCLTWRGANPLQEFHLFGHSGLLSNQRGDHGISNSWEFPFFKDFVIMHIQKRTISISERGVAFRLHPPEFLDYLLCLQLPINISSNHHRTEERIR